MCEDCGILEGRSYFSNHAFSMIGDMVYDACIKVDTDANPDYSPHTESWLIGESWNEVNNSGDYNQKVIDDYPVLYYSTGPAVDYYFTVQ
jgi:hypothetical protein